MRAIKFKHQNKVFAEYQKEYFSLPALQLDTKEGEVITCWKMSFLERLKVLFTGKVWLVLLTFNKPLTPSNLSLNRKDFYSHTDDEKNLKAKIKERAIKFREWIKL